MYEGYDPERIGLLPEWLIAFIEMHNRNHPEAKFKIGDKVLLDKNEHEILAVNVQDKDVVEYAISNYYHLIYEDLLEEIWNSLVYKMNLLPFGPYKVKRKKSFGTFIYIRWEK